MSESVDVKGFSQLAVGIVILASNLKNYGKYPLIIFGRALRIVFTCIVPIGFMAYYPACYFLRERSSIPFVTYLSPLIGFLSFVLASKVWIHYAEAYAGTGS